VGLDAAAPIGERSGGLTIFNHVYDRLPRDRIARQFLPVYIVATVFVKVTPDVPICLFVLFGVLSP